LLAFDWPILKKPLDLPEMFHHAAPNKTLLLINPDHSLFSFHSGKKIRAKSKFAPDPDIEQEKKRE